MLSLSKPSAGPVTLFARLSSFAQTATFRLTLVYSTIFFVSVGILFAAIFFVATRTLYQQARGAVEQESRDLVDDYNSGGISDLIQTITRRVEAERETSFYYALIDASGRHLAGRLPVERATAGWNRFPLPAGLPPRTSDGAADARDEHRLLALGTSLPNQLLLIVGFDEHRIIEAQEAIAHAFALAAALTALLAVVGGAFVSVRFLARVDEIGRTTRAIMAGNLSDRVATRGSGDEIDRLAGNLNAMLDRIQALMEGLQQVSNDIAHDLRMPLTRLRQRLEAAQLKANSIEEHGEAIARAIADADAIIATFSALLRIAQIEAGQGKQAFGPVDLSDLCTFISEAYAAVVEENAQNLRTDISPGIVAIGDRDLLTQLIANLIENAIRHCPKAADITLSLSRTNRAALIDVVDTGPGIPPAETAKVLRRFYRLEKSRTTPGSGLGLALVKAISDLHEAELTLADNHPGLRVTIALKNV